MGMLYEYSDEELLAMGLLTEEQKAERERLRDKYSQEDCPADYPDEHF